MYWWVMKSNYAVDGHRSDVDVAVDVADPFAVISEPDLHVCT